MIKKVKDKGINPELEKVISELLRATMIDPTASLLCLMLFQEYQN